MEENKTIRQIQALTEKVLASRAPSFREDQKLSVQEKLAGMWPDVSRIFIAILMFVDAIKAKSWPGRIKAIIDGTLWSFVKDIYDAIVKLFNKEES